MTESIRLPHKPDTPLSYMLVPGQGSLSTTHLVVFLNGLILPQTSWDDTLYSLQQRWAESENTNRPSLLTYDRYGQGKSDRDPADKQHDGTHDIREVVRDLHALVQEIWKAEHKTISTEHENGAQEGGKPPRMIFVANSIGCVIARLYADAYPGTVEALLLLDSNIANSDLVSIFPDPDAPNFDPAILPKDVTVEDLRHARKGYKHNFHPSVPNPEHLDRMNIAELLPDSDKPPLRGPDDGKGPWITVVGHDWETFAEEGSRGSMNVPKSLTNAFMNPAWSKYNEGLVRLTEIDRAQGPVIARHCGHFIQKDDPKLVAELAEAIIEKVEVGGARQEEGR
ncbi:alpha/beta-hydrolase [Hypoxylon fuscum]|nr:alpha/beta-hydrolase [Hypoxylon fuscum]